MGQGRGYGQRRRTLEACPAAILEVDGRLCEDEGGGGDRTSASSTGHRDHPEVALTVAAFECPPATDHAWETSSRTAVVEFRPHVRGVTGCADLLSFPQDVAAVVPSGCVKCPAELGSRSPVGFPSRETSPGVTAEVLAGCTRAHNFVVHAVPTMQRSGLNRMCFEK